MKVINEPLTTKAGSLALLASILWGGNSISIKVALAGVPPIALACIRFLLGALIVLIWTALIRVPLRLEPGEKRGIVQLALLFVVQIYLLNAGTDFTLAGRSTILISTHPFFTALFAHLMIPGDRLSRPKVIGMALSFTGIVLVFGEGLALEQSRYIAGDLMVLTSGLLLGLRIVYIKRLTQGIHPGRLLLWQAALSIPVFALFSSLFEAGDAFRITPAILGAILYQGVIIAGFAFILWAVLLRRYMASKLGVFQFATPVFGVLFSNLLLGEPVSPGLIASMLLVGAGIAIVNYEG